MNTFSAEKVFFHSNKIYSYINTGKIPTPTSIDIDLSGSCNCKCFFCNAKRVHDGNFQRLGHIKDIIIPAIHFLHVNSICLGGGGEPTVNPEFLQILETLNKNNFNILLSTNGILLEDLVDNMYDIKSIGVSFEAYDKQSYIDIRKVDKYDKVIKGLEKASKLKDKNNIKDITVKLLINIYNYHKIYDMCKIAKDIGVDNVYIRPAGLYNLYDYDYTKQDLSKYYLTEEMIQVIKEQLDKSKELMTDNNDNNFTIYYRTQFKEDLTTPEYDFDKCYGCMMSFPFSTDGYVYTCVDNRGNENYKLCKHEELTRVFDSGLHRQMINFASNNFREQCPRCSKAKINSYIKKYILNDESNRNFL